jgi:hypothetical protein
VALEIRDDFKPVEQLLRRGLVYAQQLEEFNRNDWVHLRNREDFNRVYSLPQAQCHALERVYQQGRDMAGQLSYLLAEFNYAAEYPTFKSFVEAVEKYVSQQGPRLEETLGAAGAVLAQLERPPWAVEQMISLCRQQLQMVAALAEWVRQARATPLLLQESGAPPTREGRSFRAFVAATWKQYTTEVIIGLFVAVVSSLIVAAIF